MSEEEKKPWYGSKTILTLVVALAIQIWDMLTAYAVPVEIGDEIANLNWDQPLLAVLTAAAIVFRFVSTKKIKGLFSGIFSSKNDD